MLLARLMRCVLKCVAVLFLCASVSAEAFTFETLASRGCHEELTLQAQRAALWPQGKQAPSSSEEDNALAENLPFSVDSKSDYWTLSLLIGVRDNDTRGHSLNEFAELAGVHQGYDLQAEHCLRAEWEDGEDGDLHALQNCREFILREMEQAIGDKPEVDLSANKSVPVALRYQSAQVSVNRYAFHMGRAIHALQDSFAHSFRRKFDLKITGVLNYVDFALDVDARAERDGHQHLGLLDLCEGRTEFDEKRIAAAREFSRELLMVASDVSSAQKRRERIHSILDRALGHVPGCSVKNDWCDTLKEIKQIEGATWSCSSSPSGVFVWAGAAFWLARRRFRSRSSSSVGSWQRH